jgi:hypothetical protein
VAATEDSRGPCEDMCARAHEADIEEGEGATCRTALAAGEPCAERILRRGGRIRRPPAQGNRIWQLADPYNAKEVVPDDGRREELPIRRK